MQKAVALPKRNILLFQGGGALGAYQAGVYEALNRRGVLPDWVVGTSIGAINAALIAGNRPQRRLEHLFEFWARMGRDRLGGPFDVETGDPRTATLFGRLNAFATMLTGRQSFFRPRWNGSFALGLPVAPDAASLYDVSALRETLLELVDFDYLADSPVRLSVGAVNVETAQIVYFDSRDTRIGVEHILASGALPPAFPAVAIDGQHYWDGGLHSNTPLEWVLRDSPRRHSLCFLATLWPGSDAPPASLADVLRRAKELQYASRADNLIELEKELHRLRHDLSLLAERLPASERALPEVARILDHGCRSVYHLVRLQAPRLPGEDQTKDIDFAPSRIAQRWSAGCGDTLRALDAQPWTAAIDPEDGVVVHDFRGIPEAPADDATGARAPRARTRKAPNRPPAAPREDALQ